MTLDNRERARRISVDSFGLPTWLENVCPYCDHHMPIDSILGFGIEMSPKMFGNFAITYICPSCTSMCEFHYVKAVLNVDGIVPFLQSHDEPSEPKTREELINSSEHNLHG